MAHGIESRLDDQEARLRALEARIAALETGTARREARVQPAVPASAEAPAAAGIAVISILSLVGRTLVVLGGAFLLRAVTEAGAVPQVAGTVAGLAYALLWVLMADRAAARGRQADAAFHGLASAAIAFPLIAEATLKFRFLSPTWGAAALTVTFALGLGVSWRRTLLGLAWIMCLGSVAAALGMAFASRAFLPFVGSLLVLGGVTLWLGYTRNWTLLAGCVAAISDLMVLFVTLALVIAWRPTATRVLTAPGLLLLQCGLVAVYGGGFAWRSMLRRRDLVLLEIVQAALVVVIGVGGAVALVGASGGYAAFVGVLGLLLGASCYAVAFTFIDRRQGRRTNFLFYSTFALVFTLVGVNTLLVGALRSIVCATASLCTAWIGSRWQRATLSGHGAFYAVAAGMSSGLLPAAGRAFIGASFAPVPWMAAPVGFALAVTAVNCWLEVAKHGRTWGRLSSVPKLVVLCSLCLGIGGIVVSAAAPVARVGQGDTADAAALAAIRTGVLALAALVLGMLSHRKRFSEAFWLVYPVLVLGGVKLLAEDLRHGRPTTVFASLVLYGTALIVAPRLVRRRRS